MPAVDQKQRLRLDSFVEQPKRYRLYAAAAASAAAKSLQSCLTLCDPIDSSPPGSSVPGILQARILLWVAISFSNAGVHAKLLQSCLTLCNPMDCSPPGSSVHGDSPGKNTGVGCHALLPRPRDRTPVLCLLHWRRGL